MSPRFCSLATFLLLVLMQPHAAAVTLDQVQTFDDPDHGWIIGIGPGAGTPDTVPLALGEPGGPDDPYLSIMATGGAGPRSRLSAQNLDQWSGDYLASGVNLIRMDVNNFGATDLFLRLLFVEFGTPDPVNIAFSSDALFVPGNSGWHMIEFDVSRSALTAALGSVTGALSNADELRIFHNPEPFFVPTGNPAVVAHLGVDNITAPRASLRIAEPSGSVLLGLGLLLAGIAKCRRRPHHCDVAAKKSPRK